MRFALPPGAKAAVIASTESHHAAVDADALTRNERVRREVERAAAPVEDPLISDLTAAASQFIVSRGGDLHTVIAGYHWFSDWGRDTMIAASRPWLSSRAASRIARDILLAFSRAADLGMLPNRFPDVGERPEYNSVGTHRSGISRRFANTSNTRPIIILSAKISTPP